MTKTKKMGSLSISNKILDKYFGYLKYLDNNAKKYLINRLTISMEKNPRDNKEEFDLESIAGKWIDSRSSDEIINEIRMCRVEKVNISFTHP